MAADPMLIKGAINLLSVDAAGGARTAERAVWESGATVAQTLTALGGHMAERAAAAAWSVQACALADFNGRNTLADASADKPQPFLTNADEPNPALGVRGHRTALTSPGVMAPMIATADEAAQFAALRGTELRHGFAPGAPRLPRHQRPDPVRHGGRPPAPPRKPTPSSLKWRGRVVLAPLWRAEVREYPEAHPDQKENTMATKTEQATAAQVLAELAELEDPKVRAVNERHGDDHGVNLGKLRALAKRLKTQQELAVELWDAGETAGRLVALLICRPKAFEFDVLDRWLREARIPKVHDWLVNYVVKKSRHAEALRQLWLADPDPVVASAGWALTSERVVKSPEGLDLPGLLDVIEAQMKSAPERLQWGMNNTLAMIGIENPGLRARALDIGERLEVLKDYPTPPNCTSPFAPSWINEMVRRQAGQ